MKFRAAISNLGDSPFNRYAYCMETEFHTDFLDETVGWFDSFEEGIKAAEARLEGYKQKAEAEAS